MKRTIERFFPVVVAAAALTITSAAHRAEASDETQDTDTTIEAPLDAADCVASTISVLGLTIDVSAAQIEGTGSTAPEPTPTGTPQPGDDGNHGHGSRGVNDAPPGGCYYCAAPTPTPAIPVTISCGALVVGQPVEVRLGSDQTPLAAIAVKQRGGNANTKIEAPIQAVDAAAHSVTVLGLTIDAGGAGLDGSDDSGDHSQAIDVSQLIIGQFVELQLASSTAPLSATEFEVKNFTNQLEVEIRDTDFSDVDDVDAHGNPIDDVQVDVTAFAGVHNPAGNALVHKQLELHTRSNGGFSLAGLPTGGVRIQVTRRHNGATQFVRRSLIVRPNTTRHLRLRLRAH